MGILDILSSAPTKNPYAGMLSDEAWQYYQQMQGRQRTGRMLRNLGNNLSRAASGLPPTGGGGGRGGGGQNDLMQMMKMNQMREGQQDRDAARQDKAAERQRAKRVSELLGANTQGPTRAPGGYGVGPVTQQSLMPQDQANRARLLAQLALGDPNAAITAALKRQKLPQYYKPQVVREGDKDVMKRYSKSGRFPPLDVKAGPAQRRDKDTRTAYQKNIPYLAKVMNISEKDAAELVTQSRSMLPEQFRQRVYLKALAGGYNTPEEAAAQTEAAMQMFYPQKYPAPEAPTPPPPSPGIAEQVMGFFKPSASATAPSGAGAGPVPRYPGMPRQTAGETPFMQGQTVPIGGKPHEIVEVNPDGTYIVMDLSTGETSPARIKR